jgi:hypothetical protein
MTGQSASISEWLITLTGHLTAQIEDLNALFTVDAVSWSADGERDRVDAPHEDCRDDWPGFDGP